MLRLLITSVSSTTPRSPRVVFPPDLSKSKFSTQLKSPNMIEVFAGKVYWGMVLKKFSRDIGSVGAYRLMILVLKLSNVMIVEITRLSLSVLVSDITKAVLGLKSIAVPRLLELP